ncbi:MAG: hypothetical protein DDT23_00338 [candidate division WS2 bacterium]|nr:hypothetical protein [Candidatus Lithacetigena glycinireducens]
MSVSEGILTKIKRRGMRISCFSIVSRQMEVAIFYERIH